MGFLREVFKKVACNITSPANHRNFELGLSCRTQFLKFWAEADRVMSSKPRERKARQQENKEPGKGEERRTNTDRGKENERSQEERIIMARTRGQR